MQRSMLKCNGVQTQVITEGSWVEEGLAENGNKHVVLVIPGNPGVPQFYEDFIKVVNSKIPSETPVWVVGHAGHVQPNKDLTLSMPNDSTWHDHYGLNAQVKHKAEFIKKYVPKDAKLHLVAHSIGCWVVLNLLRDKLIASQVSKCYLLFPTIEHMAESRNGKFFNSFVSRIATLLVFLSWVFWCFPLSLQVFLIRVFGMFYGFSAKSTKAVLKFLNPNVVKRVIRLGKEEMEHVRDRDNEVLAQHADKLWFYYGSRDGWTPVRYYKSLKNCHPYIDAELCQRGFHHSFVLEHDKEMGQIVGDLINENISKTD